MKTERRHELEANSLARGLNDWGDKLRPYTSIILGVIAALLGIYIVTSLWNSYQERRDRAAWDAYQAAVMEGDLELSSLQRLANSEDFAGTDVQEWALLGWADRQLLLAARTYLTERDAAKERLNNIVEIYREFANTGSTPEVRNRARLGLARVHEMEGDLDEAKQNYQQVQGALSAIAEQRIKTLESQQAQATIDWLATADLPKPVTPTGPGTPGQRPGFEAGTPPTDPLGAATAPGTAESLEDILNSLGSGAAAPPTTGGDASATPAEDTTPPIEDAAPADEDATTDVADDAAAAPPAEGVTEDAADDSAAVTEESAVDLPADEAAPAAETEAATDEETPAQQ